MNPLEEALQAAAAAASTELVEDDELVEVVEVRGGGDGEFVAHPASPRRAHYPGKDASLVGLPVQLEGRDLDSSHSCVWGMISASTNARTLARNSTWDLV